MTTSLAPVSLRNVSSCLAGSGANVRMTTARRMATQVERSGPATDGEAIGAIPVRDRSRGWRRAASAAPPTLYLKIATTGDPRFDPNRDGADGTLVGERAVDFVAWELSLGAGGIWRRRGVSAVGDAAEQDGRQPLRCAFPEVTAAGRSPTRKAAGDRHRGRGRGGRRGARSGHRPDSCRHRRQRPDARIHLRRCAGSPDRRDGPRGADPAEAWIKECRRLIRPTRDDAVVECGFDDQEPVEPGSPTQGVGVEEADEEGR